jgi:glycosyltransferase involved in cell wall biosynthesis
MGGFSPHKNLEALVSAFARIAACKEFADVILVMTGDTSGDAFHTYFGTIAAQVKALGLQERVIFTGFLEDSDAVLLLNLAAVLLLPSLMEGFGLPAVEAAACGCPVIATKASPLPGLLGRGGIYVGTGEDDIAGALETVLSSEDLRREMSAAALTAANRLTWDLAGRQMLGVIERMVPA